MLHHVGGARSRDASIVDSYFLEQPPGSAVAAGHPAPNVLVKVDEQVKSIVAGSPAQLGEVVEVCRVVIVGPAMLDCFPGSQQAEAVESPCAQARKMFVGFADRKRAADERYVAVV